MLNYGNVFGYSKAILYFYENEHWKHWKHYINTY